MRYLLGLDVAKDSFVAALVNEAGELVAPIATFPNDSEGFAALLAWLPQPASTIGMCEPTGVYNQHLKHALAAALESLHEMNSQTLRQFAFTQVRTKTDQADAMMIADAARTLSLTKPESSPNAAFRSVRSVRTWPCGWPNMIGSAKPSPRCGSRSPSWTTMRPAMLARCSGGASRS